MPRTSMVPGVRGGAVTTGRATARRPSMGVGDEADLGGVLGIERSRRAEVAACRPDFRGKQCDNLPPARMARRALITGITGQDGSYLADLLLAEGTEVVGLVRGGGVRTEDGEQAVDPRVSLLE